MSRIVVLDNTKRYTKDNIPKYKKDHHIPKLIDEAPKIGLSHLLHLIPILGM